MINLINYLNIEIAAIKSDSRYQDSSASIFANAPLALIQETLRARLSTLLEIKDKLANVESREPALTDSVNSSKYFSFDGYNYETYDNLDEAKREAESAIEYFSEQLADQNLDPVSDGDFHRVSYGIVLAESGYSVDHIVTQDDVDRGEYSYEVGTQIMSLFLNEAIITESQENK